MTNKELLFRYIADRLIKKYNVSVYQFKKDNRISGIMMVVDYHRYKPDILYNWKECCYYSKSFLTLTILHEIYHAMECRPYNTKEEMIEEEYQAERFALDQFKRIDRKEYEKECRIMKKFLLYGEKIRKFLGDDSIHHTAYSRIKEYQK